METAPSTELGVIHSCKARRPAEGDDDAVGPCLNRSNVHRTGNAPSRSSGADFETSKGSHRVQVDLVPVEKRSHLGYFSTTALILNKIIGTGIYGAPKVVLTATGSKGISLMIWLVGCVMTWAGLYIYLEYGIRWPVTGGELHYVNNVYTKPYRLFTYIFASMFILVNGVQANALQFGKEIILGASPRDTPVNSTLQKFFAVIIITFVCQLQSYSRVIYVQTSNILAVLKVFVLVFIAICGVVALSGARKHDFQEIDTPYGTGNLTEIFGPRSNNLNEYSLALLNVMRAFLGYENANFVLTEIKSDPQDERRIFRRAMKISVITSCILYIVVNVAFFTVCTTEEIINAPETLPLFLQKIFGMSEQANLASSVVVSFSAGGAIIALTFANAREIARMGLVLVPEFWAKTSHRRTPAHALFLHWIFTVLCIAITPLDNAAGFLIMNTFYSYVHTYISILLGCGLLCAPWLGSFEFPSSEFPSREDPSWRPQSSSFGWWLLGPLVIIYIASNAFVLILSWFPANLQVALNTTAPTLPYYTGPVAGLSLIGFGVFWWAWDLYILPWLGYHFWIKEDKYESEFWRVEVLQVHFYRRLDGFAKRVYHFWHPAIAWCWKFVSRELA